MLYSLVRFCGTAIISNPRVQAHSCAVGGRLVISALVRITGETNMADSRHENSEPQIAEQTRFQHSNRRAFIVTAASVFGAAAFLVSRRLQVPIVEAGQSPGPVVIVQFSELGKTTGKVTVPRVVKSDAEWKQQPSPFPLRWPAAPAPNDPAQDELGIPVYSWNRSGTLGW
jgi:hypothetical protein